MGEHVYRNRQDAIAAGFKAADYVYHADEHGRGQIETTDGVRARVNFDSGMSHIIPLTDLTPDAAMHCDHVPIRCVEGRTGDGREIL